MPWGQILLFIVASLVQRLLAPKPPQPKPLELSDFELPTADEGRPIPVVFGTMIVRGPNVTWYGDLRVTPIKEQGSKK